MMTLESTEVFFLSLFTARGTVTQTPTRTASYLNPAVVASSNLTSPIAARRIRNLVGQGEAIPPTRRNSVAFWAVFSQIGATVLSCHCSDWCFVVSSAVSLPHQASFHRKVGRVLGFDIRHGGELKHATCKLPRGLRKTWRIIDRVSGKFGAKGVPSLSQIARAMAVRVRRVPEGG